MDMVARAYGDLASLGEGDEGDNDQDEEQDDDKQDEEQDADEEQDEEQDEEDEDYLARYAEQRQSVDQEDEEEEEEEDEANGQVEEEDSDAAEMESLKQLVAMLSQEHHHGKISKGTVLSARDGLGGKHGKSGRGFWGVKEITCFCFQVKLKAFRN